MADAPVIPPLPTPSSTETGGSAELASDFMRDLAVGPPPAIAAAPPAEPKASPVTPAAAPAAPAKAATPPEPPKAAATPPAAAAKPDATPAPAVAKPAAKINVDDPKLSAKDLRDHLKAIEADRATTVAQKQTEISTLQAKIAEFEKREYWTDDQKKAKQQADDRLAQLESNLYGRDYRQSPEFKTKFQDRFDRLWKKGSETVKGLTITWTEGEEQKTRPASERDLLRVVDAPASERYKLAKQLFGEDHAVITDYATKLNDIREEADDAVKAKQEGYQAETQQQTEQLRTLGTQIETFVKQASDGLVQQFPDVFAAKEDQPEVAAALKKGFDFVDESRTKQATMSVNERAARIATIRAWAGAFPRLMFDLQQLRAEVTTLREENGKYRNSDPGTLGEGGGGGGGGTAKDGGSDDLAAEIDALNKR